MKFRMCFYYLVPSLDFALICCLFFTFQTSEWQHWNRGDGAEQGTLVPEERWCYSHQSLMKAREPQQQWPGMKLGLSVRTRWRGKQSKAKRCSEEKKKGTEKKNGNRSQKCCAESPFNSPPVVMFSHVELFSHPRCMPDPPHCKSVQREKKKEKGGGRREREKERERFGSFFQAVTMKAEEITLNGLNSAIR